LLPLLSVGNRLQPEQLPDRGDLHISRPAFPEKAL